MKAFVSTAEIYRAAQSKFDDDLGIDTTPVVTAWHYGSEIAINNVKYWEKVYFQSNDLGIYAAHDPYVEYFIIMPYFFIDNVETYYGSNASISVFNRAKDIGINLVLTTMWTPLEKI